MKKNVQASLERALFGIADADKGARQAATILYAVLEEIRSKRLGKKAFSLVKKALKELGR